MTPSNTVTVPRPSKRSPGSSPLTTTQNLIKETAGSGEDARGRGDTEDPGCNFEMTPMDKQDQPSEVFHIVIDAFNSTPGHIQKRLNVVLLCLLQGDNIQIDFFQEQHS